MRSGLYTVLAQALERIGIPWNICQHEDRGDGILVTIPPTVSKSVFVNLPQVLVDGLRRHNEQHPAEEQIRLRVGLHAGELHYDDHGVVGRSVILAFRLLDSQVLRDAVESAGLLAVIVSAWFYDEVIWHAQVTGYQQVEVRAKEVRTTAWIWLPDSDIQTRSVPALRQLPTSIRQLVGRELELGKLMEVLDGTVIITAIDGSAGIGKTTLALYWAHRVKDRFPDGHLHVNLRGFDPREPMDAGQALHDFLQALGVAPRSIPKALDAKAALYRSMLADRRVLIVLDNARSSDHVRPLLPGSSSCVTIITSRNRLDSLTVREGAHRISLDVLPTRDALTLLAQRVQDTRVAADPQAATELANLCARLPLALSIVAARAASQPALSLTDLAREVREERNRLDAWDPGDIDLSIRSVFSWSYKVLSPQAAQLFRYLGAHPGPNIDLYACNALVGGSAKVALNELTRAHMLTEYAPRRFRFHDLLRAYAIEQAKTEAELTQALQRMFDYYLTTAQDADQILQPCREGVVRTPSGSSQITSFDVAMAWFTAEQATLQSLITFAAEQGFASQAWRLAWAYTTFLRRKGRFEDRLTVNRIAVEVARRSGDNVGRGMALRQLASTIAWFGKFDEALEYLREAFAVVADSKDPSTECRIHLTYARVFEGNGKYTEALAHARRAWKIAQGQANLLQQAETLNTLGKDLLLVGKYAEALPYSERARSIFREFDYTDGQADALVTIGDIKRSLGEYTEAVSCHQQALTLNRQIHDKFWEARGLEHLGATYQAFGEREHARAAFQESLAILRKLHDASAERVSQKLLKL
ncbi:ATP-binding protein [Kibdelosporangium lantanae]|uniref:ATP-binding protein n=1 Tax=Kibdelosporangium lantanae TaxID=1497396 RepID=A0ABW3M5N8_9PSEU